MSMGVEDSPAIFCPIEADVLSSRQILRNVAETFTLLTHYYKYSHQKYRNLGVVYKEIIFIILHW